MRLEEIEEGERLLANYHAAGHEPQEIALAYWMIAHADALIAAAKAAAWRPIDQLQLDETTGYGFRIFAPSLVDADFNPSGTAEAVIAEDGPDGYTLSVAKWNGTHDCWDSVEVTDATHFMLLPIGPLPGEG